MKKMKMKMQAGVMVRAREGVSVAGTSPRTPGFLKGNITVRQNFNAPLELAPLTPPKKKKHTQDNVSRRAESKKPMTRDPKKILAALKMLMKEEAKGGRSARLQQAWEEAAPIDWRKLQAAIRKLRGAFRGMENIREKKDCDVSPTAVRRIAKQGGANPRLKSIRRRRAK